MMPSLHGTAVVRQHILGCVWVWLLSSAAGGVTGIPGSGLASQGTPRIPREPPAPEMAETRLQHLLPVGGDVMTEILPCCCELLRFAHQQMV